MIFSFSWPSAMHTEASLPPIPIVAQLFHAWIWQWPYRPLANRVLSGFG